MALSLKYSVRLNGLKPEMIIAAIVVNEVYSEYGYGCVATSICDSVHSLQSRHYIGEAIDFRTRHLKEGDGILISNEVRRRLGSNYYVALENDHLHVGYRPTGR